MSTDTHEKHTPGPWDAWDDDGTGTLPCVLAKQVTAFGNFYVAQCNNFADARLTAAAPELLDMLKQVLMRLDLEPVEAVFPCSAMRHDIRAALAKAEPHA